MGERTAVTGVINAAGSMTRIGTTTECLQLCRFLKESGYRAAYVEFDLQNYLAAVSMTYASVRCDPQIDHLVFSGIPMYSSKWFPGLRENGEYDWLVCDYGNVNLRSFDRQRFLEGDARILLGGVKPSEIGEITHVLADPQLRDSILLFSFVPKSDEEMIRELLEERSSRSLFAPYMPDPFGCYRSLYRENGYFYALMDLVLGSIEEKHG